MILRYLSTSKDAAYENAPAKTTCAPLAVAAYPVNCSSFVAVAVLRTWTTDRYTVVPEFMLQFAPPSGAMLIVTPENVRETSEIVVAAVPEL